MSAASGCRVRPRLGGFRAAAWFMPGSEDGLSFGLDCGEKNEALRRYYTREGFRVVGRRDFNGRWYSVGLLERVL